LRIAYIAPYQGPEVIKRRPIVRNLSLAGQVKVRLIAELLNANSHEVEVISQGEVIERQLKYYPGFCEADLLRAKNPVLYASALPVKFVSGLWSGLSVLGIFRARHRVSPFDLVMIYNLKPPQVICAHYAIRRLGLPVVLEYEDGAFVDRTGRRESGILSGVYRSAARSLLKSLSGCLAVSPRLLSQTPCSIPKLLLRGVIGDEILSASQQGNAARKNRVVFSGTHFRTSGLEQLIQAWRKMALPDWELHIAGFGNMTPALQEQALGDQNIIFHGLLNREENARLLCSSLIGVNPHDISAAPGNVFPVKIIEYLAAGTHVITTPVGMVEPELEVGMTYMPDNSVDAIAATISGVIRDRRYQYNAREAVQERYSAAAVSRSLEELLQQAIGSAGRS
jgi:glycosyltransferase involved in cell wall biosynthesis